MKNKRKKNKTKKREDENGGMETLKEVIEEGKERDED